MSSEQDVLTFLSICGTDNRDLAIQFLDMAGGNMETAISLYFDHEGESQLRYGDSEGVVSRDSGVKGVSNTVGDEELAQSLQREAYKMEGNYRPPDQARHEQLVDTRFFSGQYGGLGGVFQPFTNFRDMFDESRPSGIFNQRLSSHLEGASDEEDQESAFEEEGNTDGVDQHEYVEERVVELDDQGQTQEYIKLVKRPKVLTKEERMRQLFRPPFDMMSKIDLETAKYTARHKHKWIMLNIQAVDIFQCQMLNRDLWSSHEVRSVVKPNFVFLQYQYGSRLAQNYVQFYDLSNKDDLPHIAILDPLTGERLKQWHREVPQVEKFVRELQEFLTAFSLDPKASNPSIRAPTSPVNRSTLSEDQQMNLAIQKSLVRSPDPTSDKQHLELEETSLDPHVDEENISHANSFEAFCSIQPIAHPEPDNNPVTTTRIQIRTGDGKRIVRRFNLTEDTVRTIYEVIKATIYGCDNTNFLLTTHNKDNLIEKLNETIADAGLKNSSLILETISDD